jgi:DNA polymerase-3 subunit epsilon
LWPSPRWDGVTYWALDLETGGLDAKRDPILAVGMVPVREATVRLSEAYDTLVRPERGEWISADSVRAHQLVPTDVRAAPPLRDVLLEVDRRLAEGALLVHQAAIDVRFLKRGYRNVGLRWRGPRVVDTVDLLERLAKKERFIDPERFTHPDLHRRDPSWNLGAARRRLGLPEYAAHHALTDAIATAELFLVLRKALGARTLRDLR